ncbi:response regulator [Paenibacillus sp. WQ 127069]|uniref:Response regulator n=1 Tax=Paenibacillus baimaensis TaxID=2982185 RepID=A0ABT2UB97_9BACL|nr:response regulator [Paenibacillus sp. WQ 127069]MCU6791914.1 response regulator [Paenibacillus sp. WQ 127069]
MTSNCYRVMIVDDEYYFRKLLIHLIDWTQLGYVIEDEAENGSQALELAHNHHYDLIIVDINMPGITGLDFVEALRTASIEAKVIFITSYDIFEYARAAVSLGASYYLLKPIDEDELMKALVEIRGDLDRELEDTDYLITLKEQAERAKPLIKDQFVRQLLLHEPSVQPEILERQAEYYHIPISPIYVVIVAEIDHLNHRFNKEEERQLWRFAVKNILQESLETGGAYCEVIDGEDNHVVVLTGFQQITDSELYTLCEHARTFIDHRMKLRITLAFGQTYESLSQVHLSYSESVHALKQKFINGGNQVIAYTHDHINSEDTIFSPPLNRVEWLRVIRQRNREEVVLKVDESCMELINNRASKETALFVLMECISLGNTAILEQGGTLPIGWMTDRHPLFRQMHGLETVTSMQQWLVTFFDDIVFRELDDQLPRRRGSDIVIKATEYIEKQFSQESVTLQQAARELSVNPSYLSHIFKKETGKSFIEFLTDVRLDKAMELLKDVPHGTSVSLKIVDVSQSVGYADPYYFSRCFKKKFGVVPSKILL